MEMSNYYLTYSLQEISAYFARFMVGIINNKASLFNLSLISCLIIHQGLHLYPAEGIMVQFVRKQSEISYCKILKESYIIFDDNTNGDDVQKPTMYTKWSTENLS